jgi:hypothetical protein
MSKGLEDCYDAIEDGSYAAWQEDILMQEKAIDDLLDSIKILGVKFAANLIVQQDTDEAANLADALSFALFDNYLEICKSED